MGESGTKIKPLEEALKGLVKLTKALGFYPAGHPILEAASVEAYKGFLPLLGEGMPFRITVRKEGFFLDNQPVAAGSPPLQKLAHAFFSRKVQSLLILPDLLPNDLETLCRNLGADSGEMQQRGGFQQILMDNGVATIWFNEIDIEEAFARKAEIDAHLSAEPEEEDLEPSPPEDREEAPETASRTLETVVSDMRQATDGDVLSGLVDELLPLIEQNLNKDGEVQVLSALAILLRNAVTTGIPESFKRISGDALDRVAGQDVLEYLFDLLCTKGFDEKYREAIFRILNFLRRRSLPLLMDRLVSEEDAYARRSISEAIIRQGKEALPLLYEYLYDGRWFVVRNTVAIIGEIREPSSSERLHPVLLHDDTRVRREVIRALTRIGTDGALHILLETAEGDNAELARQAILSLGAMKDTAAVPPLLGLLERSDATTRRIEVTREVIKALGEIADNRATGSLSTLLTRRTLWRRAQMDDLRILAAKALGEIGGAEAVAVLETASQDRSEEVALAAADALRALKRKSD